MDKTGSIQAGKRLGRKGLVEGASGNISVRDGDNITITRKGTVLDDLNEGSFVTLNLEKDDLEKDEQSEQEASSDYVIHKAIYRTTDFKAIVHCHGVFNVVISLVEDEVNPPDFEGKLFLGKIPVLEADTKKQERQRSAKLIAGTIKECDVAVLRGHGIYSAGHTLLEALHKVEYVEHSCEILYRLRLLSQ